MNKIIDQGKQLRDQLGNPVLRTIYAGGGTPSVIPPRLADNFLYSLNNILGKPKEEFTWEANPEGIDTEALESWANGGVTRLSVGIQTFDSFLLDSLDRRCNEEKVLEVLKLLGASWKGKWSADLITGIPGQSWKGLQDDLIRLVDSGAKHISLYSLTVEEGTPLEAMVKTGQVKLLKSNMAEGLWLKARDWLVNKGFSWYEISNFAIPGYESKHNLHYWNMDPYAGLGPGAAGTLPILTNGGPRALRTGGSVLFDWLSGGLGIQEILEPKDFFWEHLLVGLRKSEGIPWLVLERRFPGFTQDTLNLQSLAPYIDPNPGQLTLTNKGRQILDGLLVTLMSDNDHWLPKTQVWPK